MMALIPKVGLYRITICIHVIIPIGLRGDTDKNSWDVATKAFFRYLVRAKFYSVQTQFWVVQHNDMPLCPIYVRYYRLLSLPRRRTLAWNPTDVYCSAASARMALSHPEDSKFCILRRMKCHLHPQSSVPHSAERSPHGRRCPSSCQGILSVNGTACSLRWRPLV